MKTLVLILLPLLFLCSSCVSYKSYTNSSLDFPLKSSGKIEVFYPGELLPYKEYIRIGDISVENIVTNSHAFYIEKLQSIAQKAGVDALIELEESRGEYGSTFTNAVCIKYIRNLDYLDEYVKKESFFEINYFTDEKKLVGIIERTPAGKTLSSKFVNDNAQNRYETSIQNYRDFHLVEEEQNWRYRLDAKGIHVIERQYYRTSTWALKTCKLKYEENKLSEIKIMNNDTSKKQEISYSYNPSGKISGRKVQLAKNKHIEETYQYDKNGRISGKEFRLVIEGEKAPHLFTTEYEYYKKEDIHDFIDL